MSTHLYDVFISHATEDLKVAEAIAHHLESGRARTYLARQQINAGTSWRAELARAIEASRSVVLIVSEHSNQSKHVRDEVTLACESGLTIFPFKLANVSLHDELKMPLAGTHWLDAIDPPLEAHIQRLASDVCAKLGIPSEGPVRPAPPEGKPFRLAIGVAVVIALLVSLISFNIVKSNKAHNDSTTLLDAKTSRPSSASTASSKWDRPSAQKIVQLVTEDDVPIEQAVIQAERIKGGETYDGVVFAANGIKFKLKMKNSGPPISGKWAIYYHMKAVAAPNSPSGTATISTSLACYPPVPGSEYTSKVGWELPDENGTFMWVLEANKPKSFNNLYFYVGETRNPGLLPSGIHEIGIDVLVDGRSVFQGETRIEIKEPQ